MRFWTIFFRGCRLRCPRCGGGKLFRNWFQMNPRCRVCDYKYERDPGYFLGSIYFNYGLTALLLVAAYVPLYVSDTFSSTTLLWIGAGFSLLFPLWFFRYARSLWAGFDQYWDPAEEEPEPRGMTNFR
jgi:uncharacterized protein (DUF983 family)